MSKQTSVYSPSEEVKHFHGKHLSCYVGKLGLRWMLAVFTGSVKCNPGTPLM